MEKVTLRLPDWEVDLLRARSRREGRSLNTVASEVLAQGLGEGRLPSEVMRALEPLLARPPVAAPVPLEAEVDRPELSSALDWARGER
ncbi:MAG: hypothetical protein WCB85_11325 [Candidatus Dormiibacterota bacterium]